MMIEARMLRCRRRAAAAAAAATATAASPPLARQVEANHLLAIMGSSGAGKTTLLDVLACNTFGGAGGGSVTGQVHKQGAAAI